MIEIQERVLREIEAILIRIPGTELVRGSSYANVGTLYLMEGVATLLQVTYDFQPASCWLTFSDVLVEFAVDEGRLTSDDPGCPGRLSSAGWHVSLRYDDGATFAGMLTRLSRIVEPSVPPPTRARSRRRPTRRECTVFLATAALSVLVTLLLLCRHDIVQAVCVLFALPRS